MLVEAETRKFWAAFPIMILTRLIIAQLLSIVSSKLFHNQTLYIQKTFKENNV